MLNTTIKGIIFDMDNTLLHSNINFKAMKAEVVSYLLSQKLLPSEFTLDGHTTSTAVALAKESILYNKEIDKKVWEIATLHELEGMKDSKLEMDVLHMLDTLSKDYILTILTNNSYDAAIEALERNRVTEYFNLIVGREQAKDLKPAASGISYILNYYPDIPVQSWLSIGDSWIDGVASINAGVNFVLYQGNINSLNERGVKPLLHIKNMLELLKHLGETAN